MAVDVNVDPYPQTELFTEQRARFEGREFTRDIQGRWVDEWGNQIQTDKKGDLVLTNGKPTLIKPPRPAWNTHSLARWKGREIPIRQWFLDDWIPMGQVVSLYGRPGARKSTLLLQWMIASVLGGRGFGPCEHLATGPCYGLFCEDDEAEIARRAEAIIGHYGASFDQLADCHAESLVGAHLTHFCTFRRSGILSPTPAWEKFIEDLDRIQPVFVCLDVVADFFGGNEINRNESSSFLRLLDTTANERGFALVFSGHPSLRGLRDGTLQSGSTGWEGKVRGLMTLADPSDEDDDENNPKNRLFNQSEKRTLTLTKSNYAKSGAEIDLVIRDGFFQPADIDPQTAPLRGISREIAARSKFIDLLDAVTTPDRWVHDSPANKTRYAPKVFATHPDHGTFSERDFARAMKYLLDKKRIKITAFTHAGRPYRKLENSIPEPNRED